MKYLPRKIVKAMITYEIELVEIMSGIAAFSWGLWLINPAFNSFASTKTFDTMAMLAPEWMWGIAMMLIGFFQVESVLSHRLSRRKTTSIILSTMWIFITALFAYANVASTATVIYGTFAFFTIWSYLRLSQRVEIVSKFSK